MRKAYTAIGWPLATNQDKQVFKQSFDFNDSIENRKSNLFYKE